MLGIPGNKLILRLLALSILIFSLVLVSRNSGGASSERPADLFTRSAQTQDPTVTVETQADAPLAITSLASSGRMAPDSQFVEFGFYVVNVSAKPVRAFAIKEEISVNGKKVGGGVSLYNPQLSGSAIAPNQSTFIGETSTAPFEKPNIITLSVDFVEFVDGTKWGLDSVRSSERTAGQRAAANAISQRLLQTLSAGKIEDAVREIDGDVSNAEPPPEHSDEWKEGFRSARVSVLNRLKRVRQASGSREFERELRRLGETFKGKD